MSPEWETICRDVRVGVEEALAGLPTREERELSHGIGAGGDETAAVDAVAEAVVLERLAALHADGHEFSLVSEEAGERRYGRSPTWRLVVDPIDGSANAKRGLPHFAISIAVAEGPTIGDVVYGYVFDLAAREEWTAIRGGGARLDGHLLGPERPRDSLEIVALEATRTRSLARVLPSLVGRCERVRVFGSLALSLCHLAAARVDGACSLQAIRSVDIAAAQLIALESGISVALPDRASLAGAPLDLERRSRLIASGSPANVEALAEAISA
ncbi:MAG: inositol monophosphatase family protein [Gaiellales bacterium]